MTVELVVLLVTGDNKAYKVILNLHVIFFFSFKGSLELYKSVNVETFQDITTRMKPVALAEFQTFDREIWLQFWSLFFFDKVDMERSRGSILHH